MNRQSPWAIKVAAIVQSGNMAAALAQIKVAPTVKDLQQLRKLLGTGGLLQRYPTIDETIADMQASLSAPRLHRSP